MSVLIYDNRATDAARHFQATVASLIPAANISVASSLLQLEKQLHRPRGEIRLILLLPSDASDLTHLVTIGDLILDRRTIVLLPEWNKEMVKQGHRLRPRFMGDRLRDTANVDAVLAKMLTGHESASTTTVEEGGGRPP